MTILDTDVSYFDLIGKVTEKGAVKFISAEIYYKEDTPFAIIRLAAEGDSFYWHLLRLNLKTKKYDNINDFPLSIQNAVKGTEWEIYEIIITEMSRSHF